MTPLLKKEIRLLLPAWVGVVLLVTLAPWLGADADMNLCSVTPLCLFFGMILLAVDSFGREFSLGTFSSFMAQPVDRRQLWQTKINLLLAAAGLVFVAYYISCEGRLHLAITSRDSLWSGLNAHFIIEDSHHAMLASVVIWCIALAGGLWTTLLLRQLAAAFWIALLAPVGLLLAIAFTMDLLFKSAPDAVGYYVLLGAAVIYAGAAFWQARRLFFRAQDAGWSGGVISLERWRYFEAAGADESERRPYRPVRALLKKEFSLNSISLFCMGTLLVLHGVVIVFRLTWLDAHPKAMAATGVNNFWIMWLVMPLVIGCTTVAEERKLGVADSQLCLPVSRRRLFAVKFIPAMIFGLLLGGVMPVVLENIASRLGVPGDGFKPSDQAPTNFGSGLVWFQIGLVCLAGLFAAVGFLASTLARNFLHALSIAIGVIAAGYVVLTSLPAVLNQGSPLWWLLAIPILGITYVCVARSAFYDYHDLRRLWWRYLAGAVGAVVVVFILQAAIYQRVWEKLTPFEPAHGPARWSLDQRPVAHPSDLDDNLLVTLPDGRVWSGLVGPGPQWRMTNDFLRTVRDQMLYPPAPRITHPKFIPGTNWLSVVAGSEIYQFYGPDGTGWQESYQMAGREIVAIRTDGTLWVSAAPTNGPWNDHELAQFGTDTNWRQALGYGSLHSLFLLKTDGTLWSWGQPDWRSRTNWPGLRAFVPRQIGTNSDWQGLLAVEFSDLAQKSDGTLWNILYDYRTGLDLSLHNTNLETAGFNLQRLDDTKMTGNSGNQVAGIHADGTLWAWGNLYWDLRHAKEKFETMQVGRDTNWVAVALSQYTMTALKSDGTLWRWGGTGLPVRQPGETYAMPPEQLGTHADWVALMPAREGVVTLAADGSLWLWPLTEPYEHQYKLLSPPQKPAPLGNILAAE